MPMNTPVFKLSQTATYELIELDGDQGKLKVSLIQSAPSQEMKVPNLPPGASAKLNSLASTGSGTMRFYLNKPIPHSEMKATMNMESTINASGQTQDMKMKMGMNIKIWPKE